MKTSGLQAEGSLTPFGTKQSSGSRWIALGFILIFVACGLTSWYFFYDTTIPGPDRGRLHNSGLMHNRLVGVMIGCTVFIGGQLFIGIGLLSQISLSLKKRISQESITEDINPQNSQDRFSTLQEMADQMMSEDK